MATVTTESKTHELVETNVLNRKFDHTQIESAVAALYEYLEKKTNEENGENDNLLWDDVRDINLLIEAKTRLMKAKEFRSFRIPLIHSWRQSGNHEICIITRSQDVSVWENILLTRFPVAGVTRIIGLKEFTTSFESEESRIHLCDLFDLFIVHPVIIHLVSSKLAGFLKNRNKFSRGVPFLSLHIVIYPCAKV